MLQVFSQNYILLVSAVLVLLFILSQILHIFDLKGAIAAVVLGAVVSFLGYITWLILLIIFALSSHIVTKYRFQYKKEHKYQEGELGERRIGNVVYAGAIGLIVAVANFISPYHLPYFLLFSASFAAIAADTFASEIGTLDSNTYMITTFKRTNTGINGGVSVLGEIAALAGASIIGLSYSLMSINQHVYLDFLAITIAGFISCQVDSLLGALFENDGKLSKGQVNFLASFSAILFVIPFFAYIH